MPTEREAVELAAMVRRMLRALVRRAAKGDTTALEALGELEALAPTATTVAMALSHVTHGGYYTYGELAQVTGTSRQAVQQRVGRQGTVSPSDWAWLTS